MKTIKNDLSQRSSEQINNSLSSYLNGWVKTISSSVSKNFLELQADLENGGFSKAIRLSNMFTGRRPGWHCEKDLKSRIKAKGFGKLINDFKPLAVAEFQESLDKGEKQMASPKIFVGDTKRLNAATLRVLRLCKFPNEKFKPVDFETAFDVYINKSASSGFPKFIRKGKIRSEIIYLAYKHANSFCNDIFNYPLVRAFRIQIRETLNVLRRKVRVMYMYPGFITLIEASFGALFVQHFIKTKTFYCIGENGSKIGDRLRKLKYHGSIVGTDVSAFDQSLLNEVIIRAFWILRSQMSLTFPQGKMFDNIVSYFCCSLLVSKSPGSKESYGFIKAHGLPSGSFFTNMVGSLCHAIMVEYLSPNLVDNSMICSDDIIFDGSGYIDEEYRSNMLNTFNLVIEKGKVEIFKSNRDIYFLGFRFINFERHISYQLTLNQIVWHSDFNATLDKYDRELGRSASILLNGVNGQFLFRTLFPKEFEAIKKGKDIKYIYMGGSLPPSRSNKISESLMDAYYNGYKDR